MPISASDPRFQNAQNEMISRVLGPPEPANPKRKGIRKAAHKFKNSKSKVVKTIKKVIPIAAGIVGHILGGPPGAAVGAGIGNGLVGKGNFGKNALKGGLIGGGMSLGANVLGGAAGMPSLTGGQGIGGVSFGGGPGGFAGMGSGMGNSVGGLFGGSPFGGASSLGGPSAMSGMGGGGGGMLSGITDFFGGPLNTGLAATMLAGNLLDKPKVNKYEQQQYDKMMQQFNNPQSRWSEQERTLPPSPKKRRVYIPKPPGHDDTKEHIFFRDEPVGYKKGGYVKGYIKGSTGGQDDLVNTKIRPKSYVLNSTDISLIGDGNSENGVKKWKEAELKFMRSGGFVKNDPESKNEKLIPVSLSHGEYYVEPEIVTAIGKGNNEKGAKTLDKMRKNLRIHKGVKKILPPKTKSLTSYMR